MSNDNFTQFQFMSMLMIVINELSKYLDPLNLIFLSKLLYVTFPHRIIFTIYNHAVCSFKKWAGHLIGRSSRVCFLRASTPKGTMTVGDLQIRV